VTHRDVHTVLCQVHSPQASAPPFPLYRCDACDALFCEECLTASSKYGVCPECAPRAYPLRPVNSGHRLPPLHMYAVPCNRAREA
jgi:hypothetical protein